MSENCSRIIKLLLITGQRLGEVSGTHKDEIDLGLKQWTIPGIWSKNGFPHVVPLWDLAVEIIREMDGGNGPLFRGEDGAALNSHFVGRAITRAREGKRFEIASWSAHDLRRTALTGMALRVSPHVIAHVANHRLIAKSGVTFAHYVMHAYEKEKRAALDMWSERLAAVIGPGGAEVVPIRRARR